MHTDVRATESGGYPKVRSTHSHWLGQAITWLLWSCDRVVLLPPRESVTVAIQSGRTVVMRCQLSGNEIRVANARSGSVAAIAWGQLGVVANDWCRAVGWAALNP